MNGRDLRSADLRKGWCPGALRPMMARDGLLVRLRLTSGIVSASNARALAALADTHGNGLFDLSARANLQMRGVREGSLPALLDGLRGLGLLDTDAAREAVRNVIASPLAGLDTRDYILPRSAEKDHPDTRPIVAALEVALVGDSTLHALPAKFGVLIDDGSSPTLADVPADVRFDWSGTAGAFAISLGGTRREAAYAGLCPPDAVVGKAIDLARQVIALQSGTPRRMRRLLADLGPQIAADLFGILPDGCILDPLPSNVTKVGARTFGRVSVLGLAAPFGRLDAAMLRTAAGFADHERGELRLSPWRTIFVPCASAGDQHRALAAATAAGFVVDPADPRLRIAACAGRDGCERGTTPTHADAAALADLVASLGAAAMPLHVSGCAKGCARPYSSVVTLVGRDGRYDVVREGRPGDPPVERGLGIAQVRAALVADLPLQGEAERRSMCARAAN